ncbi:MAG: hypothetical protein RLZZ164_850 [Actinomycetota bacterium]|jgi:aminoglycoside phosphotransferase (APT) family kinase protein
MGKSPLILAALAADAVRNLKVAHAAGHSDGGEGRYESAILTDKDGLHYIARIPTSPSAGTDLELEMRVLKAVGSVGSKLPFEIPHTLGETRSNVGERVVVFKWVYGNKIIPAKVPVNGALAISISNALVAMHSISPDLVVANGFRDYSVAENLRLRTAELDRAAQTSHVPAILLQRWEQVLEDAAMWRYQPTVIHGNLSGETMLEQNQEISGVIEWTNLELNDPALDFRWLGAPEDHDLLVSVLMGYQIARGSGDTKIAQRAAFYNEFQHLQYLLHGHTMRDNWVVEDASNSLQNLAAAAEEGQLPGLTDQQVAELTPVHDLEDSSDLIYQTDDGDLPAFLGGQSANAEVIDFAEYSAATEPINIVDSPKHDDDTF